MTSCSGLTVAGHQGPPKAVMALPSWTGERKCNKRVTELKQRQGETTHHLLSQVKQTKLGEINGIYY